MLPIMTLVLFFVVLTLAFGAVVFEYQRLSIGRVRRASIRRQLMEDNPPLARRGDHPSPDYRHIRTFES